MDLLPAVALHLGLSLAPTQLGTFGKYCELLRDGNRRMNLTSVDRPQDIIWRHFVDALSLVSALEQGELKRPLTVVDVGTGAGIPGLVLAIAFPRWSVTLVESIRKKASFVQQVSSTLELKNVMVLPARAEVVARSHLRDSFDLGVARAVARAGTLVEYLAPLVRPGGCLCLYKSGDVAQEMIEAQAAMKKLRCHLRRVTYPPGEWPVGKNHAIVVLEKTGATPELFPRRIGAARSKPL